MTSYFSIKTQPHSPIIVGFLKKTKPHSDSSSCRPFGRRLVLPSPVGWSIVSLLGDESRPSLRSNVAVMVPFVVPCRFVFVVLGSASWMDGRSAWAAVYGRNISKSVDSSSPPHVWLVLVETRRSFFVWVSPQGQSLHRYHCIVRILVRIIIVIFNFNFVILITNTIVFIKISIIRVSFLRFS